MKLQIKTPEGWQYVFCHNDRDGVITTKDSTKALPAEAMLYIQSKHGNDIFRVI